MSGRPSGYTPTSARCCAYCGHTIATVETVHLLTVKSNRLVGPFHDVCAEKIRERSKKLDGEAKLAGLDFGRVLDAMVQKELGL